MHRNGGLPIPTKSVVEVLYVWFDRMRIVYDILWLWKLVEFIFLSISADFQILLVVDANKHMIKGKLTKELISLGLAEAYIHKFNKSGPASYFRGVH